MIERDYLEIDLDTQKRISEDSLALIIQIIETHVRMSTGLEPNAVIDELKITSTPRAYSFRFDAVLTIAPKYAKIIVGSRFSNINCIRKFLENLAGRDNKRDPSAKNGIYYTLGIEEYN